MKKLSFLIVILLLNSNLLFSQVGINSDGSAPDASAGLDVNYTNKGFLPPRMTHAELNAISYPASGLIVYCTDCGSNGLGSLAIFMAGAWHTLSTDCINPLSPLTGINVPFPAEIIWNWNPSEGASGYKWSTTDNYSTAMDMGTDTTKTETGLTCNTSYSRYVWAYSNCGGSTTTTLTQTTSLNPVAPAEGTHVPLLNQIVWKWVAVSGAASYKWNTTDDYNNALDMGTSQLIMETGLSCNTNYTRYVWAYNTCGHSIATTLAQATLSVFVNSPSAGNHMPLPTEIVWNWNTVSGATGYKWNTLNDYASAIDMGIDIIKSETGLACDSAYTRYVWAYNSCGYSAPESLIQSTLACYICGNTITINHLAGAVAPVDKTVTYGTVINIPGEPSKCWITSNLGADHQATAVDDATEASAGWYWQFNRMQGYKHDGTTRTPNTTWIDWIEEDLNWQAANDPCALEIGNGWRLPTYTEWFNVDASGGWSDFNGPWNSALKIHAAGFLWQDSGDLDPRGSSGNYHSSSQADNMRNGTLYFISNDCYVGQGNFKSFGISIRCLRDGSIAQTIPTVTTASVFNITQITATSGGEVTSDGGASVTDRGVCWSTSSNPTTADSYTNDGSGTGEFESNLSSLTERTLYYVRAYATNSLGTGYGNEESFSTTCGSLSINHLASNGVAPVDKTVTYGTVTNIPGEPSKCWITSNLGADHQANSVDDATEASAGWYWQFNRMQGYKHDGTNRTPASAWISHINENSDWIAANDPCALELGNGWRLPTSTEWTNVDASGNWTDFNDPWNSALKIHAAGYLAYYGNGLLLVRGSSGNYCSSSQNSNSYYIILYFYSGWCNIVPDNDKANGMTSRCLRD